MTDTDLIEAMARAGKQALGHSATRLLPEWRTAMRAALAVVREREGAERARAVRMVREMADYDSDAIAASFLEGIADAIQMDDPAPPDGDGG